jgi:hypothetical protein
MELVRTCCPTTTDYLEEMTNLYFVDCSRRPTHYITRPDTTGPRELHGTMRQTTHSLPPQAPPAPRALDEVSFAGVCVAATTETCARDTDTYRITRSSLTSHTRARPHESHAAHAHGVLWHQALLHGVRIHPTAQPFHRCLLCPPRLGRACACAPASPSHIEECEDRAEG